MHIPVSSIFEITKILYLLLTVFDRLAGVFGKNCCQQALGEKKKQFCTNDF